MNFRSILIGGLGNQMFQYAFAKTLSMRYNCPLYIKSSSIIYRPYMLKIFNILDNEGREIDWNSRIFETEVYRPGFENKFKDLSDLNYDVDGFWQNENYFLEIEDIIRNDFKLEPTMVDRNSVTIQVRRGDYCNNKNFEYCDLNWYKKAISHFGTSNINIISDDPNWCAEAFKEYRTNIIDGDEKKHLSYLIGSTNIIISNSTFGWWGAWLSKSQNVICPDVWLPFKPEQDTASKNWLKMKK